MVTEKKSLSLTEQLSPGLLLGVSAAALAQSSLSSNASGESPAQGSGLVVSVTEPVPTAPENPPMRMKRSVPAATPLADAMLVKPVQPPPSSLQASKARFAQSPEKISMAVSYVALSHVETVTRSVLVVV
jgi:hypothetical protein